MKTPWMTMQQLEEHMDMPASTGAPILFHVYRVDDTGRIDYIPPHEEEDEWVHIEYKRMFDTLALLSAFSVDLVGFLVAINAYVSEDVPTSVYEFVLECDDLTRIERAFLVEMASQSLNVDAKRIAVTFKSEDEIGETHPISPQQMIRIFRRIGRFPESKFGVDKTDTQEVK